MKKALKSSKRVPWWQTAKELDEMDQQQVWRLKFNSRAAWLEDAASGLDKTATHVRRYIASWRFARSLVERRRIKSLQSALQIPEVTLTALLRLDRIAPRVVDDLLRRVPVEIPTARSIHRELQKHSRADPTILGRRERSRRERNWFEEACVEYLKTHRHALSKDHDGFYRHLDLWNLRADVVFIDGDRNWGDACRIVFVEPRRTLPPNLLYEVSYSAQFFRNFWIVLPPAKAVLGELAESLQRTRISNISIAVFDEERLRLDRKIGLGRHSGDPSSALMNEMRASKIEKLFRLDAVVA